jgi:hypothetical protein
MCFHGRAAAHKSNKTMQSAKLQLEWWKAAGVVENAVETRFLEK